VSSHDEIDTAAVRASGLVGQLRVVEELCAALDATRLERDAARALTAEVTRYIDDAYRNGNEYRARALRAETESSDSRRKLDTIKALCVYDYGPCAEFSDAVLAVMDVRDDEVVCVPEIVTQASIDALRGICDGLASRVTEIRVKTEDDES
jgi:hypothetical protein